MCFDPLQALCGGLDLNLPQHAQHVCGELATLAAETGASVIVSHHFRKGGEITGPEQAREAVRGSGGLVDGVRAVYAVWPVTEAEGKPVCKTFGERWERGRVVKGAIVKANFRADLDVQTLVRNSCGLLVNRTFELGEMSPRHSQVSDALTDAIAKAAMEGKPFAKTEASGLHERRHELPQGFHNMGRQAFRDLADELLSAKRLEQYRIQPKERHRSWLDAPGGALSRLDCNLPGATNDDGEPAEAGAA